MWFGPMVERTIYLARRGQWAGLLPYPAWWSWFGPDYVPLVLDHLSAGQVVHVGSGVFHARGEAPLDRGQLTAALRGSTAGRGPRRALRVLFSRWGKRASAITWLPAELLPVEDDSDQDVENPPLIPAVTIPVGLRTER